MGANKTSRASDQDAPVVCSLYHFSPASVGWCESVSALAG
jgi:hypothetical protein